MPAILDVIAKTSPYSQNVHYYVVLDEMPKRVYARQGNFFIAHDDGFYDFLCGRGGKGEAFAGREFHIDLEDGTQFHCQGQVWSSGHGGHVKEDTLSVGVGTKSTLEKCYVFSSASISRAKLDAWLADNKPSGNYYKYDPRHTIKWLDSVFDEGDRKICKERARALRRRGVRIFRDADGQRSWSPYYERRKAKILAEQD